MSKNLDTMGKVELRAACKAAGIVYGKLNNDGMRAALAPVYKAQEDALDLQRANAAQGIGPVGSDGRPAPKSARAAALASPRPPVLETPVVDVTPRETVTGKVVKPKSLKIEKVRDVQNKVTRPSAGSICRSIWDHLDAHRKEHNAVPTFENLRDLAKLCGWSKNTAMTQYQRWKQFNGVMPRTAEAAAADEAAGDETDTEE